MGPDDRLLHENTLAELPVARASAADDLDLEAEDMLRVVRDAHVAATGERLPADAFSIRYPKPDPD